MPTLRLWKCAALALGLTPLLATAGEPGRLPLPMVSPNQQMADTITRNLMDSGRLRQYRIDVAFQDGTVELTGTVTDQMQREEALRLVQGVPGVVKVRDRLTLAGSISPVQAAAPQPLPPPLPGGVDQPRLPPPLPGGIDQPPAPGTQPGAAPEPTPIFQGPAPGPYDMGPPKMPPYAWPTYAPYNNFSRVGYPTEYPYQAWPFIGPVYPFPKIPPGWRSVKLQWEDGHWWFSTHCTKHDFWRMRYW